MPLIHGIVTSFALLAGLLVWVVRWRFVSFRGCGREVASLTSFMTCVFCVLNIIFYHFENVRNNFNCTNVSIYIYFYS